MHEVRHGSDLAGRLPQHQPCTRGKRRPARRPGSNWAAMSETARTSATVRPDEKPLVGVLPAEQDPLAARRERHIREAPGPCEQAPLAGLGLAAVDEDEFASGRPPRLDDGVRARPAPEARRRAGPAACARSKLERCQPEGLASGPAHEAARARRGRRAASRAPLRAPRERSRRTVQAVVRSRSDRPESTSTKRTAPIGVDVGRGGSATLRRGCHAGATGITDGSSVRLPVPSPATTLSAAVVEVRHPKAARQTSAGRLTGPSPGTDQRTVPAGCPSARGCSGSATTAVSRSRRPRQRTGPCGEKVASV